MAVGGNSCSRVDDGSDGNDAEHAMSVALCLHTVRKL